MALQSREGSRVPEIALCRLRDGVVQRASAAELFGGRRVILFALPGAFTPTCSTAHVPGYVARAADFKSAVRLRARDWLTIQVVPDPPS